MKSREAEINFLLFGNDEGRDSLGRLHATDPIDDSIVDRTIRFDTKIHGLQFVPRNVIETQTAFENGVNAILGSFDGFHGFYHSLQGRVSEVLDDTVEHEGPVWGYNTIIGRQKCDRCN